MNPRVALLLYPAWALAVLIAAVALRLGRARARSLISLCGLLALWISILVLARLPTTAAHAERLIPFGMLLAGGFAHAHADLLPSSPRAPVWWAYAFGAAVGLLGWLAPHLIYAPGLTAPGPLFWPLFVTAGAAAARQFALTARTVGMAEGLEKRRRIALALGQLAALLGGGGIVSARILLGAPLEAAAPPLVLAALLIAYAIVVGERRADRRLVVQGLVYAAIAAALSSFGLSLLVRLLPALVPGEGATAAWLVFVMFFASLPLAPLHALLVDWAGRRLFADPIGPRDLADEVTQARDAAEHAERLASIGTMAAAVAHEMRNPLGVIAARAALLERRGADTDSVNALRAEVTRARRFLDDLLRYSQAAPLQTAIVPIDAALRAAFARIEAAEGPLPHIELSWRLADDARELEADPRGFEDVAAVLLHNARAALAERPHGTIGIATRVAGAFIELTVEDDGPGVPRDIEPRLFQPFVSGRGRDALHPGTGLGLAIAARWLDRHGGGLHHERPSGGGARFVVRWPRGSARHA